MRPTSHAHFILRIELPVDIADGRSSGWIGPARYKVEKCITLRQYLCNKIGVQLVADTACAESEAKGD